MKKIIAILFYLFSSAVYGGPQIIKVGAVDDLDCDFNSAQLAIDSVIIDSEIHISNQLSITQGMFINNQPISKLMGGLEDCSDNAQIINNTSVTNNMDVGLLVSIQDSTIPTVEISGFDFHSSLGGVDVINGVNQNILIINIHNVNIFNNTQVGLNVEGVGIQINISNALVFNNVNVIGGSTQGGGIRCANAEINILENMAINDNQADIGAGIYAANCQINLSAGELAENGDIIFGIFDNIANEHGGGIYAFNTTINGSGSTQQPLIISRNAAISNTFGRGGAISMASGSNITLLNAFINNNTASHQGGAIYADSFNITLSPAVINIGRNPNGCDYAEICSTISNNIAQNSITGKGGVVYLRRRAIANINQTEMANNQADDSSAFHLSFSDTQLNLEGNSIHHNGSTTQDNAVTLFKSEGVDVSTMLNFNTITQNRTDTIFELDFNNSNIQTLKVFNSIISNIDSQIINHDGGQASHIAEINCSILHNDSTGGITGNGSIIADPLFVDDMNDFHLQAISDAIDVDCSNILAPAYQDIEGKNRLADSIADMGAFEYIVETIFLDGFE